MTRFLRYGAIWIVAVALVGAVAFFGVARTLQSGEAPSLSRQQIVDARKLEKSADELRALLTEIGKPGAQAESRIAGDIRPRVRQAQQEILRTRLSVPAYDALLTAADRLAAYAASPRNAALYDAAKRAQTDLDARVEAIRKAMEAQARRDRAR